jgi:porin
MRRTKVLIQLMMGLWVAGSAAAQTDSNTVDANSVSCVAASDVANESTLTHGFWGLGDALAGYGIEVALGATNLYQANVNNGLDTHGKSGRFTGSYDLQIAADLEKLAGIPGLGLFVHGKGGWPDAKGIDETRVGSVFGVNTGAIGDRSLDVVQALLEWSLSDGRLTLMIGKMDFAGVFDTSAYANDETSQFLNFALVNNPTVPLPDYCLGLIATVQVTDAWSVSAGVGDAQADGRETGFRTAFYGEDYFFYALETGVRIELASPRGPLPGATRLGLWYDPQPKAHSDGDREYRDDTGFYAGVDQMLVKENDDPQDGQGLGIFGRYGWADGRCNDIHRFWSLGIQYQGLLPGRDDDVLGLGFAQGVFTDEPSAPFTADSESVSELYYSLLATPWATISPGIQYISHPGGDRAVGDATVAGVRAQIVF